MCILTSSYICIPFCVTTTILLIFFIVFGIGDDSDGYLVKKSYRNASDAKHRIEEYKQEQEERRKYNEKIEHEGKTKVVGVYLGDEYIDGDRLERMKKMERVVDE